MLRVLDRGGYVLNIVKEDKEVSDKSIRCLYRHIPLVYFKVRVYITRVNDVV
jgi:hypothetical protein